MGEWEHYCQGCKASHMAGFWYHREVERDLTHEQEWLCGVEYNDLSLQERNSKGWKPKEPN